MAAGMLGSFELAKRLYFTERRAPEVRREHPYPEASRLLEKQLNSNNEYPNSGLVGIQYKYLDYFVNFLEQAAKYEAVAYGGFVRSLVLATDCQVNFTLEDYFAKDLDVWFKDEKKLRKFVYGLQEKVTIDDIVYTLYFGKSMSGKDSFKEVKEFYRTGILNPEENLGHGMIAEYGFWKRKVDVIGYDRKNKISLGFVGSIDLVLSPEYMPVSDFVANTLTFDGTDYVSANKTFNTEEIIGQICKRSLVLLDWGDTDLPKRYLVRVRSDNGKEFSREKTRSNYSEILSQYSELGKKEMSYFVEKIAVLSRRSSIEPYELKTASQELRLKIKSLTEGDLFILLKVMTRMAKMGNNGWNVAWHPSKFPH